MEIKQEILDIAFLETTFKTEFFFMNGWYYEKVFSSSYRLRFTPEQVEAERINRRIYK